MPDAFVALGVFAHSGSERETRQDPAKVRGDA